MTLEKRIVRLLVRENGRKLCSRDVCAALGIEPGGICEPSQGRQNVIEALCKLKEYGKISGDYPTPARPEFVYWIEPPKESAYVR